MPFAQFEPTPDVCRGETSTWQRDPMLDLSPARALIAQPSWREWPRSILPILTALALLIMGIANIVERATSTEVEDGVLWVERSAGVVAAEVADASPARRAGIAPGD